MNPIRDFKRPLLLRGHSNGVNEIRNYGRGSKVLYTEDKEIKDKLIGNQRNPYRGWKGCWLFNIYYDNKVRPRKVVGWDIIFPVELTKKIKVPIG